MKALKTFTKGLDIEVMHLSVFQPAKFKDTINQIQSAKFRDAEYKINSYNMFVYLALDFITYIEYADSFKNTDTFYY